MGTRADFYVGRGPDAEWIGSMNWDGYPATDEQIWGVPATILTATTAEEFRAALASCFEFGFRDGVIRPEDGWPWLWDSSAITDYTYAFDGDKVYVTYYGQAWLPAAGELPWGRDWPAGDAGSGFPDMRAVEITERG